MDQRLEIGVLGELRVTRGGQPVPLPPSRKTRALLAYLAIHGRPQRRERLCEMFWEVPDDPRGALRWSLSKIRQIVKCGDEDPLDAQRETVLLRTDGIEVDFRRVAHLDPESLDALDVEALEAAAGAFRGNFLEDLHLPRCPEFEAWRTYHADTLEILRIRILRALVHKLRDRPDRALAHAHALRQLSPEDDGLAREVERLASAARASVVAAPPPSSQPPEAAPETGETAEAPPQDRRQEIRFCRSRDGVRIAYAVTGRGPPIVRAAHWMSHLEYDWESPIWRHWIDGLSQSNTLIRYDERASGLSDWEAEDLSFDAMVADLEAVIDAAGVDRFTLLGVSQSCAVSVAYAVRHPERVARLLLYGGYVQGWRRRSDPREIATREALSVLMREGWGQDHPVFGYVFTSMFIPGASTEQMGWFSELQRRTVSPANAYRLQHAFAEIDVTDLLPRVGVPTLVVHARGDLVAPIAQGRAFAAAIPGARFIELDSHNHVLLRDEPAFARLMEEVRAFAVPEAAAPAPPEPARKQVSVLAIDLVSPVLAFESSDPELVVTTMDPPLAAALAAVERVGGTVLSKGPTELTAVFGAPGAIEDHAWQACRAALAARTAVEEAGAGAVRLRAGIDTGEVVVRTPAAGHGNVVEIAGAPVRTARQLATSLRRGVIAATARAQEAAGGYVRMEPLPREDSPSFAGDRRLFELLAENRALSRWHLRANQGLTPLVGRAEELRMLSDALARAAAGDGRAVGLMAEPGIGKSRLTHEFLASSTVQGCTVLDSGALEFDANVSYAVVKKLLRALCGIGEGDGREAAVRLVARKVEQAGAADGLLSPLLFALDLPVADPAWDALDGAGRARRIREAVCTVLAAEARRNPVVMLVEDLHWADAESEAVLAGIVERIQGWRMLLVLTYRPEYRLRWADAPGFRQVRLAPLGSEDARSLLAGLLGDDPSLAGLVTALAERTDGVPLFMEETVRTLVQNGGLVGGAGRYRAVSALEALNIPRTVQSVIAARLDRLPDDDRRVLQIAAVIGKDVPFALLEQVSEWDRDRLAAVLARLQAAEFLYESRGFPDAEYTFKHAITHDVAYGSLLRDRRQALHGAVLASMERLFADRIEDRLEKLAHHAVEAAAWEPASRYCVQAADRATERSAYDKASRFLAQAARAVAELPETEERLRLAIDIRTRMRTALNGIGDFRRAVERLAEAHELAVRLKDWERLAEVLLHQSYISSTHGDLDEAIAKADELKALAVANGFERYAGEADVACALGLLLRSEAAEAERRLAPNHERYAGPWRTERFGLLGTRGPWFLGSRALACAHLGRFREAARMIADAHAIAEQIARPFDRATVCFFGSRCDALRGDTEIPLDHLRATIEASREGRAMSFQPWLLAVLGHLLLIRGETEEATRTLEAAVASADSLGMRQFSIHARVLLACSRASGLEDALGAARELGDRWLQVLVLRRMGGVYGGEAALGHLNAALTIAESAQLRPEVARCRAALGRALRGRDEAAAAAHLEEAERLRAELGLGLGEMEADGPALAPAEGR